MMCAAQPCARAQRCAQNQQKPLPCACSCSAAPLQGTALSLKDKAHGDQAAASTTVQMCPFCSQSGRLWGKVVVTRSGSDCSAGEIQNTRTRLSPCRVQVVLKDVVAVRAGHTPHADLVLQASSSNLHDHRTTPLTVMVYISLLC